MAAPGMGRCQTHHTSLGKWTRWAWSALGRQRGDAEAIIRHNQNLHNALDAALNLKRQVERARTSMFADDDLDNELDDLDDDSEEEQEAQAKAAKKTAAAMI